MATSSTVNPQELEAAHGAEPLDELLQELSDITEEWAQGGALFGAGGFANDVRKKMLSVVMLRLRDDMLSKGEKAPTEKVLDAMAHADKQYVDWLDRHVVKRADWLKLDMKKTAIEMRANRGQSLLRLGSKVMG